MGYKSKACLCGAVSAAVLACVGQVHAVPTIDGSLSTGEGYVLASTQTQPTDSNVDSTGGPQPLPASDATATTTGNFTQLSNVYTYLDTASNTLNMFIGGSINTGDAGVSHYIIALQTRTGGVSSLSNQLPNGSVYQVNNPGNTDLNAFNANDNLDDISFDAGFLPTDLLIVEPNIGATNTGTQGYTGYTDLTGGTHSAAFNVAYNGSLQNIPVGTGASGDPGFAGASTGTEISIPLTGLGYVSGTPILASIFTTNGGTDGRTNNQVLAPFVPNPGDTSGGYDYTYIDNNEGGNPTGVTGRQFTGSDYPGLQYFAVPGTSVPEPATLGLLALGGLAAVRRRSR